MSKHIKSSYYIVPRNVTTMYSNKKISQRIRHQKIVIEKCSCSINQTVVIKNVTVSVKRSEGSMP